MPNERSIADELNNFAPEKDIFSEEPIQESEEVVEDEKSLPFHKDPKVQRYIEKQVEKATKREPARVTREEVAPSDVKDVIEAFTTVFGNDTPEKVNALSKLEKVLAGSDERASQKAVERFQREQQEAAKRQTDADQKAQEELNDYFDEIEETYDVDLTSKAPSAQKLRASFIEYVRKIAHKNENGEVDMFPDLVSSFEEFQEKNKRPTATRAKELANRGMTRSGDTTTTTATGKSWKDVERYFSTLSGN